MGECERCPSGDNEADDAQILMQWLEYPKEGRGGTVQPSPTGFTSAGFGT